MGPDFAVIIRQIKKLNRLWNHSLAYLKLPVLDLCNNSHSNILQYPVNTLHKFREFKGIFSWLWGILSVKYRYLFIPSLNQPHMYMWFVTIPVFELLCHFLTKNIKTVTILSIFI